jgi:hypothetical protein
MDIIVAPDPIAISGLEEALFCRVTVPDVAVMLALFCTLRVPALLVREIEPAAALKLPSTVRLPEAVAVIDWAPLMPPVLTVVPLRVTLVVEDRDIVDPVAV